MTEMSRCCGSFARCLRLEPRYLVRALISAVALAICPGSLPAFETGEAGLPIKFNGLEIPYRIFAVYVLPGETVEIGPSAGRASDGFAVSAEGASAAMRTASSWTWKAPTEPGVTTLTVTTDAGETVLNVVILVPSSEIHGERLNGYRLGSYPRRPLNGNPLYLPPDGFIELTEHNADLALSPHFRLSQFPAKQSSGFPKYLVLREQLLLKLELLLAQVNREGIAADTFTIMSGYRTPYYNAAIKNVPYSRHVFGGAADIYIDAAPRDDVMDDLNRDGRLDFRDAQYLYRIADRLFSDPVYAMLRGGLGVYRSNTVHGPFLHIDARQQRARWGELP